MSGGMLQVSSPHQSERRFPIARVSRIVSAVQHDWNGSAISLCLREVIPVVFFEPNRGSAGWMLPRLVFQELNQCR